MKESIVEKFEWFVIFMIYVFLRLSSLRMAHKLGFVSEDDDQVDKDPPQQYSNFQYSQSPGIHTNKSFNRHTPITESPPAYDYNGR
jgi:hypothetical protein